MRYFTLLNFQHVVLYLLPTLVFMVLFGVGLAYSRFHRPGEDTRRSEITYRYPEGIEECNQPFPLVLVLIIAGTVAWAFFYILFTGLLGVKI